MCSLCKGALSRRISAIQHFRNNDTPLPFSYQAYIKTKTHRKSNFIPLLLDPYRAFHTLFISGGCD